MLQMGFSALKLISRRRYVMDCPHQKCRAPKTRSANPPSASRGLHGGGSQFPHADLVRFILSLGQEVVYWDFDRHGSSGWDVSWADAALPVPPWSPHPGTLQWELTVSPDGRVRNNPADLVIIVSRKGNKPTRP